MDVGIGICTWVAGVGGTVAGATGKLVGGGVGAGSSVGQGAPQAPAYCIGAAAGGLRTESLFPVLLIVLHSFEGDGAL